MDFLKNIVTKNKCFLDKAFDGADNLKNECDDYLKQVDLFLKTGDAEIFKSIIGKENVDQTTVTSKRKGRLRKPALADVTENNIMQTEVVIKKEKISNIHVIQDESNLNVQVKKEVEEMPAPTKLPPRKKKIKTEKLDVPKRSTRTRGQKKEANEDTSSDSENPPLTKYSDVIIQNTTITTIDISDNEREAESDVEKTTNPELDVRSTRSKMRKENKPESEQLVKEALKDQTDSEEKAAMTTRSTRTKTKQKKRARSGSVEPPTVTESKKSRSSSNTEKEGNATVRTEYEDALSVLENNQDRPESVNTTFVTSSKNSPNAVPSNINSTMVVENPKMVTKDVEQLESGKPSEHDVVTRTPPRPAKKNGNKQIFSPFEKTPLKKKVEAFERLGAESSGIPTRLTRTKKKAQEQTEENEPKPLEENNKNYLEKEKPLTPLNKFVPKVCSTSKMNKLLPGYNSSKTSTSNESLLSSKSASALKASQAEFREREKRRQEKEREALKKREALLQAQTEEKRRKREEKQQRAQQQRENLEKEMQKQVEAQRIKEEKFKQAMAEREKRHQKQKEEAEKKRLLAKKKAHELLKEKEEMMRMVEQKKNAELRAIYDKHGDMTKSALKQKMERAHQQALPAYMTSRPPLLPTADCYDSDDPEYDLNKRVEHPWTKDRELEAVQRAMITIGETMKNSFFCRQVQTPDLQEIFELIDPKKLKRTSSAIWRKPPRYTLMPTLEDTLEYSEDSD